MCSALTNGLMAANARHKWHPREKYTWKATIAIIDYIFVQDRWLPSAEKCLSYPSADADIDHVLVKLRFQLRLKSLKKIQESYSQKLELGDSENESQGIETYQKGNDSKGMFATVNRLTKQACPTEKMVRQ